MNIRKNSKHHEILLALKAAKGNKTIFQISCDVSMSKEKCEICIRTIDQIFASKPAALYSKFAAILPSDWPKHS